MKKWITRIARWSIGLVILFFVFRQIDLSQLKEHLLKSNPWLIVIGLAHSPILIVIATIRWRYITQRYFNTAPPKYFFTRHYWQSLSIGFFTPASLGMDAYRIVTTGKEFGSYSKNALIILVEKMIALLSCVAIFAALYPVVPISRNNQLIGVLHAAYGFLVFSVLFVFILFVFSKSKFVSSLFTRIEAFVASFIAKLLHKIGFSKSVNPTGFSMRTIFGPLNPFSFFLLFILSFGIQFVSSVKSQIFFCSLGADLPFIVNLFVAPTLYFIFLLPFSFGSLGIREGAYIILYGLFGVPAEIALIVSFYNLTGMLLNNIIGGFFVLFGAPVKKKKGGFVNIVEEKGSRGQGVK